LFAEVGRLSSEFALNVHTLGFKVLENHEKSGFWTVTGFWTALIFTAFTGLMIYRFLVRVTTGKERSRLSGHLYGGVLVLLRRNMMHLTVGTVAFLAMKLSNIPYANYETFLSLFVVWLVFRNLLIIAKMTLLES